MHAFKKSGTCTNTPHLANMLHLPLDAECQQVNQVKLACKPGPGQAFKMLHGMALLTGKSSTCVVLWLPQTQRLVTEV